MTYPRPHGDRGKCESAKNDGVNRRLRQRKDGPTGPSEYGQTDRVFSPTEQIGSGE